MISKNTIEKVFETARVEEVIGDFVQLKKSGSNYKGLSPFTEERTPSFMVSPAKQIWKDFSSGKGKKGKFQQHFSVYGRKGEKCHNKRCNNNIIKIIIASRASFYCSKCQK